MKAVNHEANKESFIQIITKYKISLFMGEIVRAA